MLRWSLQFELHLQHALPNTPPHALDCGSHNISLASPCCLQQLAAQHLAC
jgi:hypothetical protein